MKTYISVRYCPKCKIYLKQMFGGKPKDCDKCSGPTKWKSVEKGSEQDPNRKSDFCNVDGMMKDNVRLSRSLGVSETQIEEARKAHPGIEWKKQGRSYLPVIHNRAEKLKIMKQAKMVEY